MKTVGRNDIIKHADGTTSTVVSHDSNLAVEPKKFSLSATTEKMGLTTGGKIAKGVLWTVVIITIGLFALEKAGKATIKFHF
jgi:hypothetical protein